MPAYAPLQRKISPRSFAAPPAPAERVLRRREGSGGPAPLRARQPESPAAPPIVHDVLRSPGQALDATTRGFMEPRFGHDFSHVRVHADARAADSAAAVGALAYTAGRDVVFGAGQYAPGTASGRQILAHELAHVAQQGPRTAVPGSLEVGRTDHPLEGEADRAASRVVQGGEVGPRQAGSGPAAPALRRVPAPPSYNGVTGTIDLSRLQFTPIPDFTVGSLTAPLTLTPTLVDASLVHLSWELYDPTDNLVSGYSTLPGHRTSRTSTYELTPARFGAGAATGRYTMRLVGRNAAHEPVAYFERYFFVLASDLTTGTASTGSFGDLTFTQYGKTDGDFAAGTDYQVHVKMKFLAKPDTVTCNEIGFLQVLESSNPQGSSNHRFAGAAKAARATSLNYSVDRAPSGPSPFYGTFRQPGATAITPSGTTYKNGTGGHVPTPAELEDHPSWSQPTIDRFETCVTCRTGPNAGQVYGCVTWGFSVDAAGKVTLMPRSYRTSPTDTLKASLSSWNTWRAAQTTPANFEAAPTLK